MLTVIANNIFIQSIADYHQNNDVNCLINNPYPQERLEHLLYLNNWTNTVLWHLEDLVRNPQINPLEGLAIKRRIDKTNQYRNDIAEFIDSFLLNKYQNIKPQENARINTETPAWAIDRLSILALKIYHMEQETLRKDVDNNHILTCQQKLEVLLNQRQDLSQAIEELIEDIEAGRCYMKTYKQMKMYNDPSLNPILYSKGQHSPTLTSC
ncbi:MAG: DUF4254 domain-containing protein [Deltaproteobacteria bacterium]|jgi:hypothetical protein|nr:DUF4254 domain-containing protein [Deltaproteobacteria bacterium]